MAGDIDEMTVVLATLVPVLILSLGLAGYFWWRNQQKCLKKEQSATGQQLTDLQRHVDANAQGLRQLSVALQSTLALASRNRSDTTTDSSNDHHQAWSSPKNQQPASSYTLPTLPTSTCLLPLPGTPTPLPGHRAVPNGPRPLSANTSLSVDGPDRRDGSIPRAAPNLERLRTSRTDATNSAESFAHLRYGATPSVITEEEASYGQSPFDTPNKLRTVKESNLEKGSRLPSMDFPFSSETYNKLLQLPSAITMKSNPTHPDLVPAPLNLAKRHSVKDQCPSTRQVPDMSDGIDKNLLRRSLTGPPTPKVCSRVIGEAAHIISGLPIPSADDVKTPDGTMDNTKHVAAMVETPRRRSQIPLPKKTLAGSPASIHMTTTTGLSCAESKTVPRELASDSRDMVSKAAPDSSIKRIARPCCTTPDKKQRGPLDDKKPCRLHEKKHSVATGRPLMRPSRATFAQSIDSPSNLSNLFDKDTITSKSPSPELRSKLGGTTQKSSGIVPERDPSRDTADLPVNDIQNPFDQDINAEDKENRAPITPPRRATARANPFRDITNLNDAQVGLDDEGDEDHRRSTSFDCEDTRRLHPIAPTSVSLRLA